jgi:hypothetical protein
MIWAFFQELIWSPCVTGRDTRSGSLNGISKWSCRQNVHMYVHMHICTYICTFVRTYAHLYVHMHICTYICTFVRTHVHLYIHMYVCKYICVYESHRSQHPSVRMFGLWVKNSSFCLQWAFFIDLNYAHKNTWVLVKSLQVHM